MIKKLLCKIGVHWFTKHESRFVDTVSGKTVYRATCSVCGDQYMVDSLFPLVSFKVKWIPYNE